MDPRILNRATIVLLGSPCTPSPSPCFSEKSLTKKEKRKPKKKTGRITPQSVALGRHSARKAKHTLPGKKRNAAENQKAPRNAQRTSQRPKLRSPNHGPSQRSARAEEWVCQAELHPEGAAGVGPASPAAARVGLRVGGRHAGAVARRLSEHLSRAMSALGPGC